MTTSTALLYPTRAAAMDAWRYTTTGACQEELVPQMHGQRTFSTAGCHGPLCRQANADYIRGKRQHEAEERATQAETA